MSGTITVACKLPHGLVLRLFDQVDQDEQTPGGGTRTVKRAQVRPGQIVIRGYLTKHKGVTVQPVAEGSSYAYTENVDKDAFDLWMKQNADNPVVVNKLIFGAEKADMIRGFVREFAAVRNGLEPIDPSRVPKGIKTADEQPKIAPVA